MTYHLKEASIFIEDGTLIVDAVNVKYSSAYRNIQFNIDSNVLYLIGYKVAWQYIYTSYYNCTYLYEHFNAANSDLFSLVKPEYLEEVEIKTKKWSWKKFGYKIIVTKETRVKSGWCEFKDTDIFKEFKTSNFIIKTGDLNESSKYI